MVMSNATLSASVIALILGFSSSACQSPTGTRSSLLTDDPDCVLVCRDAGPVPVDAPPPVVDDAPDSSVPSDARPTLDLTAPWTRTVITQGFPTGIYRGADGTALDPLGCVVTAWEQGGISTRACPVAGAWQTEVVATGITGPEDARAADLDGDGIVDVVTCADAGRRCYITFRGTPNLTTTLLNSMGHGYAMQADIADVNADGLPDIVFGTRGGTATAPAVIAALYNPGGSDVRDGSKWTYHGISEAGWTMSVVARDLDGDGDTDVLVSDRSYHFGPTGIHLWDLYGARWEEQVSPGAWTNHPISPPAGSCPVAQPMCNTKTPGDEMFLSLAPDGHTLYDCQSAGSNLDSRIVVHRTADWLTWTHEVLPPMANVGHCQGVVPADVDGDGLTDLIVTNWKGNSFPVPSPDTNHSGVYLLHATQTGWERGEISGPIGGKFDNALWVGGRLITSEQLDPDGGLGVVSYAPVMVP